MFTVFGKILYDTMGQSYTGFSILSDKKKIIFLVSSQKKTIINCVSKPKHNLKFVLADLSRALLLCCIISLSFVIVVTLPVGNEVCSV